MDNLNFFVWINLNGKVRKKHEWKYVLESTCLVPSLQKVQRSKHAKEGQQGKIFFCTLNKGQLTTNFMKKSFHFTFPLKSLHVS